MGKPIPRRHKSLLVIRQEIDDAEQMIRLLRLRQALFLCCLVLIAAEFAAAQTPDTASLQGVVTGPDGVSIADVTVVIEDSNQHEERVVRTSAQGAFAAEGLPAGEPLELRAASAGFAPAVLRQIVLVAGVTAHVQLHMQIGSVQTEVRVTGAVDAVRADEPQIGDTLTTEQMRSMPLLNRRLTWLPLLNAVNRPAINQGDIFMNQDLFTANGTGRRQTWFEVDGASGNDAWGRQTIFTSVPIDAVSEMTILDNAFAADYGFGEGAVVNIVTRRSGDHYHGDLLGLWRPSEPEAALSGFSTTNASSGNDITRDTLAQGAGSVSGPLARNGYTSLLASAEYSWQNRASPVTSPLDMGNFIGHYRDWLGFLRADHRFSERHRGFLHLGADSFFDTNPNGTVGGSTLPSVDRIFRRRTWTAELGDTVVLNDSLSNEARMQFQLASPITQFSPVVSGTQFVVPISSGGTFTSGTSQSALLLNRQLEAVDTLTRTWSRNELRSGFDVIHARNGGNSKEFGGPIYDGKLTYFTCTGTASYCESSTYLGNIANVQNYTQSYGNADYVVDDTLAAVFVQDDAHVTHDFTLNLGLRYELQSFTDSRAGFAPRAGFAWNVAGRGMTTVRGGFGLYYSQVVDNSEANYALTGPTGVFNYTAAPGQAGFPSSVADVPLPAFPAGATAPLRSLYLRPGQAKYYDQFFPTSTLNGYPDALRNPYNEQWTLSAEQQLARAWVLSADYVGAHTLKIVRPLDVDAPSSFVRNAPGRVRSAQAANCTRPYWIAWYAQSGTACDPVKNAGATPPYSLIQSDVNDGVAYYDALDVNVSHHAANGSALLASYTWSHALDTVDPDVPGQNPNDPRMTGRAELGNAIFDQRHRFVLSGVYAAPFGVTTGGIATLASGLPYNVVTGVTNSGDTGATTDRPVMHGSVIGRNTGLGTAVYSVDPFVGKRIALGTERVHANLRAEAFNVLNHRNVVGFSGTWGNGAAAGLGFGAPLAGVTNQLLARELQFSAQIEF
ncbi:TonB-dependent receptor [Paracidobacterium acidisoli]|uniref:TonB-dependent receptor n=1 Tax=Paracidobacterium acidisoli TaxID=2303751 RepID=A0A372IJS6_9BACT|nr:carboxypeptidase regulatory-like domain-containing protein [Paracidobacterium acidisoli]MBT9333239.1 TonB-dependent receptor [Paracidobacterium acidisoli]